MDQVGHLTELQEKFGAKGFRVVAVSDEPLTTIRAKMVDAQKVAYWMASDPAKETMGRFVSPGGVGIPHAYLVNAFGKIVAEGFPAEAQIAALLPDTFDRALGRELAKPLAGAAKAYDKGDVGKAWAEAGKHASDEDAAVAGDAKSLVEKCEGYAAFLRKAAETEIADRDYEWGFADLETLAKSFEGMDAATWAAAQLETLGADENVRTERDAWKALEKARALEQKAEGKEKKLKPARSAYESIVKKYPGTKAAESAQEALSRLGG